MCRSWTGPIPYPWRKESKKCSAEKSGSPFTDSRKENRNRTRGRDCLKGGEDFSRNSLTEKGEKKEPDSKGSEKVVEREENVNVPAIESPWASDSRKGVRIYSFGAGDVSTVSSRSRKRQSKAKADPSSRRD